MTERTTGELHGVVQDDRGRPVADATVTIVDGPSDAPDIAMMTADDGSFLFGGLAPGLWVVQASHGQRRARATGQVGSRPSNGSEIGRIVVVFERFEGDEGIR